MLKVHGQATKPRDLMVPFISQVLTQQEPPDIYPLKNQLNALFFTEREKNAFCFEL